MIDSGLSTEIEPFSDSRLADLASEIRKIIYPAPTSGYRIHLDHRDLADGNEVSLHRHFEFARYLRVARGRSENKMPCILTLPCHDAKGDKVLTAKSADAVIKQLQNAGLEFEQCDYLHINEPWNNKLSAIEAIMQIASYREIFPREIKLMVNSSHVKGWEKYNSQNASFYDVHIYSDPETNHLLVGLELAAKVKKTGKLVCTEANMYYSKPAQGKPQWDYLQYDRSKMSASMLNRHLTELRTVLLTAYGFAGDFCYHPAWAGHYGWGLLSPKGWHPILGWAKREWNRK